MNRVVRLGELLVRQGVLAIALLLPCSFSTAVLGQQQSVPDAPTPQKTDNLGNLSSGVTPGKGSQAPAPDSGSSNQAPPAAAAPAPPAAQDQVQETPPETNRTT